ncbi:LysR family transcriptional regulator [Rhodobacteraceae bacterium 2CG4]|uniref:LysR family transcriptional regulator n=1 Tax=Halovulum marinum TaxID=2662447 RepID=A0A6L5YZB0_9RHOB|nr:LysR family transcriptional regulator [Halovulum marinum]
MNWAAVDLNLLRVFDAMMLELNTTRAGDRIGLSQPAVSAAIGRLRHITGDALFVREGNRMVPTARAQQLADPIRTALRQIEDALATVAGFDPATATHVFRILGSDYFSTLLMPPLADAICRTAPGITLQMLDHPSASVAPLLSDGTVDMAVDSRIETPDWVRGHVLYESFIVTVARADDAAIARAGVPPGARLPAALFCELPQVLMSMDGGRTGTIDRALAAQGLRRRVALTVPHFHAVALAVAEAGILGSLPVHFANRVAPLLGLAIYRPPIEPPRLDVMLYWHRRHDADAAHAWLRNRIIDAMSIDLCADSVTAVPG